MPKIRVIRSSDRVDRPTTDFDAYPQPGIIAADASTGSPLIVTLPAATLMRAGEITVVNIGGSGTVIVDTTGADTINGSSTYTLTNQYDAVTVESLGGSPGWVIATSGGGGGGGVTDHGALTGLLDDDHPQYQRADSIFTTTSPYTITDESLVVTGGAAVTLPDAASNAGRSVTVGSAGSQVTISAAGTDTIHGIGATYDLVPTNGVTFESVNISGWGWAVLDTQGSISDVPPWWDASTGTNTQNIGNVLTLVSAGGYTYPEWTTGTRTAYEFLSGTGWTDDVPVLIPVKNTSAGTIAKGAPVYATGTVGSTSVIEVAPADADDAAKMPAIGLTNTSLAVNATGYVTVVGTVRGVNTNSYTVNQTLYVDTTAGQLTGTKPTGTSELIQGIGRVTRVNASNGEILVLGAGRTNDVPNAIDAGKLTSGTVATARLGSGTASSATFLRGDQTYAAVNPAPAFLTVSGNKDYGVPGWLPNISPSTSALTAARLTFEPWWVWREITVDRLAVEVTTAAAAGSLMRLGIYNCDATWTPTSLVVDAGTIAVDPGTVPALQTVTVNVTLAPGRYMACYVTQGAPTARAHPGAVPTWPSRIGTASASGNNVYRNSMYLSGQSALVTGGLASTGTAPDVINATSVAYANYIVLARFT